MYALSAIPQLSELPQLMPQLAGALGCNRAEEKAQIRANNDYEAICTWLNEYKERKKTTFRNYQKEAERLLLWGILQKKKAFSSLDRDDMEDYFQFLANPQPREFWCAPKGGRAKRRGGENWKPFEKGLGSSAITTAISILNSLFNYLVIAGYLKNNPLLLLRNKTNRANNIAQRKITIIERILETDEWHAILDVLENLPEKENKERLYKIRLKLLVYMLYFLGIRISELEQSTWQSFRKINEQWWFFVKGKGGKLGKIPVNDELLETIEQYRAQNKMTELSLAENNEENQIPVLTSWTTGRALTSRFMNKLLKDLALKAADKFKNQPQKAEKMGKFSAHWLRHLSASMQDRFGVAFKHIRENHRHSNDDTTRLYVHADDNERYLDMQKLRLRIE
jgi:integrase